MRFMTHAVRMLYEVICYGSAERRLALIAVVLVGALVVLISLASQAVAPVAFYPFA
jgi:hypothetical protein